MNPRTAIAACALALVAGLAGCSSQEDGGTGQGTVTLGGNDVGAVTGVQCAVDGERTTITLDGEKKTTLVVSGADAPVVESVTIGEVGADGAGLAYLQGVGATPAEVTFDEGAGYTVTGTGMGTDAANSEAPVDMPFEVRATCP